MQEITGDDVSNALRIAEQTVSWAKGFLAEEKKEDS